MHGPFSANFDPYAVLGVSTTAEFEILKAAYRRLVRENHPDIAPDKNAATTRMTQINAAWLLIGDPAKRAAFDARLRLEAREKAAKVAPPAASTAHRSKSTAHKHSARKHSSAKSAASVKTAARPAAKRAHPQAAGPKKPGSHRLEEASRLLFGQAKPTEAIELCRSVIRSDFRNVMARELMGEAYLRLNQPERASAIWEQALILQPDNPGLHRRWQKLREVMTEQTSGAAAKNAASPDRVPVIHAVVRPMPVERPSLWQRIGASLRRK